MIKVERQNKAKIIKHVECGDLVLIREDPYIVSYVDKNMYLIGLLDGNRWSDFPLPPKLTENALDDYIDSDKPVEIELIKRKEFDLVVRVK